MQTAFVLGEKADIRIYADVTTVTILPNVLFRDTDIDHAVDGKALYVKPKPTS